jgi:hypothetical protein
MRNTTPSDGHVPVASEKRRAAIIRLSRGLSNLLQAGSQVEASGLRLRPSLERPPLLTVPPGLRATKQHQY